MSGWLLVGVGLVVAVVMWRAVGRGRKVAQRPEAPQLVVLPGGQDSRPGPPVGYRFRGSGGAM